MKKIIASMALVAVTSPALAQDYLGEMRRESNDYWSNLSRSYTERSDRIREKCAPGHGAWSPAICHILVDQSLHRPHGVTARRIGKPTTRTIT